MPKILIADDELAIRKAYRALLEGEGFAVRTARDGVDALARFREERPDLLLLDVMMPKKNGIVVCEEIRRTDRITPILFFTAMQSDATAVRALGLGADDYIEKSKSPDELIARVRAALGRRAVYAAEAGLDDVMSIGRSGVDFGRMTITDERGSVSPMTRSEMLVIRELFLNRGKCVADDRLFDALHGEGFAGDPTRVRGFIAAIRGKLGAAGALISNVRGVGYLLVS